MDILFRSGFLTMHCLRFQRSCKMIGLPCLRPASCDKAVRGVRMVSDKSSPNGKIVIVEGNIGVGKTTLTCQLGRTLNYRIFLEPTSKNPYLAKFYMEPKKYALKMQLWLFRQRCKMYMKAVRHAMNSGQGVLLDRSLFSDHVFASVSHADGYMSDEGYEHYCSLRNQVLNLVPLPDLILYLSAIPEECHRRILRRGRDCESGIPVDYLSSLDVSYRTLLEEMRSQGCNVMLYDWSSFGFSSEIDKDIRNLEVCRDNLDEKTYKSINKRIQDLFDTSPDINDGSFSEEEIDDDELLEQETTSHLNETKSDG